jgi:hypothetical protein
LNWLRQSKGSVLPVVILPGTIVPGSIKEIVVSLRTCSSIKSNSSLCQQSTYARKIVHLHTFIDVHRFTTHSKLFTFIIAIWGQYKLK